MERERERERTVFRSSISSSTGYYLKSKAMPSSEFKYLRRLSGTLLTELDFWSRFFDLFSLPLCLSSFFSFLVDIVNVPAFSVEQTIPPEVKSSIVERRTVNATAAKARYERVPRDSLPEQCTRKPVTVISSRGLRAKEHTREVAAIKVTGSAIVEHGNRSTRRRRV